MKIRINPTAFVVAFTLAVPALAQHPRDDHHARDDQHARDDHHPAEVAHREEEHHAVEVAHVEEAHREAVIAHRESEEDMRIRLLREQDDDRARRRIERRDNRAWEANRERRAIEERNALQASWGPALGRPEARSELNLHASRMARLNRILDVAQDNGNAALVAHAQDVIQREIARDARILHAIRDRVEGT